MTPYRRILAAIDLSDDSRAVVARASDLARAAGGTVQLLHVVEYIPMETMGDSLVPVAPIDDQTMVRARTQIEAFAAEFGVAPSACRVEVGSAKLEILRYAREQNCDLIVLGGRERHGLSILVNFTEDTVMHGAGCDVLAVRVR